MSSALLTILGSGTSSGVPQLRCECAVCRSADPRDRRRRCSALLAVESGPSILIDAGPDLHPQLLAAGSPRIDACLITHSHYDHVGGLDDLRPYCKDGRHFPTYCKADVAADLRQRNPWSFAAKLYPGVPTYAIHEVDPDRPFDVAGITVTPLPVMHARLPILGYRFGRLAYVTDCKIMPDDTVARLRGVDTLVLNALRHEPHMSHLSLGEALELIGRIGPRRTLLTHMSHDMGPEASVRLPEGVEFACDGMEIEV